MLTILILQRSNLLIRKRMSMLNNIALCVTVLLIFPPLDSPVRFQDDENAINANEGDWIKLVGRTGRTSGMPSVI